MEARKWFALDHASGDDSTAYVYGLSFSFVHANSSLVSSKTRWSSTNVSAPEPSTSLRRGCANAAAGAAKRATSTKRSETRRNARVIFYGVQMSTKSNHR